MKKIFLTVLVFLCGCVPSQKPSQTIINYTDNSQTIQVAGDGNQVSPTSEIMAQQNATPTQTTEETTKDDMWILLLIILLVSGCILYFYQKKRLL